MPKLPQAKNCVDRILKASNNAFNKSEAEELLKEANAYLRNQQKLGIKDLAALDSFTKDKFREIQLQTKIDTIQRLRNFESKAAFKSYMEAYKDNPALGLKSFMTGRFANRAGSKLRLAR